MPIIWNTEDYCWEAGRLIQSKHIVRQKYASLPETLKETRYVYAYTSDGELDFIRYDQDNEWGHGYTYRRLPKGIKLQDVAALIRRRLPETIMSTVAKADIKDPVYCLALSYNYESDSILPPEIALGLESERQGWMQDPESDAAWCIWHPPEFKHFEVPYLRWADEELKQACEDYNLILSARNTTGPARKLINEVAKDLAQADWSGKLVTTPDFVVFAVDLEQEELIGNLKQSVAPELFKTFKRAKVL